MGFFFFKEIYLDISLLPVPAAWCCMLMRETSLLFVLENPH